MAKLPAQPSSAHRKLRTATPSPGRRRPGAALLPILGVLAAAIVAGALSGCGTVVVPIETSPPSPPPGSFAGPAFSGLVMAGSQPVAGASIQIFAAGTTGNGSAPTRLLASRVTSNASGNFAVPSGYLCPSQGSQLYVVARGGSVGTGAENPAIALATAVGTCSAIGPAATYRVNEATTVALSWALAQFLSSEGDLGATAANIVGIANAALAAQNLVSSQSGSVLLPVTPPNSALPAQKLNSLASLLNTCTASGPASDGCTGLFALTTTPGQSAPADTLAASIRIVHNPGQNVAALFTRSGASSRFAPTLPSAPADWTFSLAFTGGGLQSPTGVAIDGSGSVWVASYFGVLSRFSPLGSPVFPSGIAGAGLDESYGLAIDANGNVWVPNQASSASINGGRGSVSVLNAQGQSIAGPTGFSAGGLNYPTAVAIDTDGSAWLADYGNSRLTHLSATGASLSGAAGYASPSLVFPVAVAIDAEHNVWVANQSGNTIARSSPDGAQITSIACCDGASGLTIDRQGNVWVANFYGDSISEVAHDGTVLLNGSVRGGGIDHPQGIAVDGAGDVWVANYLGSTLTEIAGANSARPGTILSPPSGWTPELPLHAAFALAIDASGNVWVTNFGNDSLTEFVGLAAPVKTPQIGPAAAP